MHPESAGAGVACAVAVSENIANDRITAEQPIRRNFRMYLSSLRSLASIRPVKDNLAVRAERNR